MLDAYKKHRPRFPWNTSKECALPLTRADVHAVLMILADIENALIKIRGGLLENNSPLLKELEIAEWNFSILQSAFLSEGKDDRADLFQGENLKLFGDKWR